MLKIMIVDDEKITRDGLIDFTDWKGLGLEVVGEAKDGYEALEVFETVKPDIILCDVRMPRMDGLEFASHIKSLFPYVQIIFLSGYSDKEYLKTAIRLDAIDYIEKPINEAELVFALKKAIKLSNESKAAESKISDLQEKLNRSINDIENNLALDLVLEHSVKKDIIERMRLIESSINPEDKLVTVIIKIYYSSIDSDNFIKSIKMQLLNSINKALYAFAKKYLIGIVDDGFIIHLSISSINDNEYETLLIEAMQKLLEDVPNTQDFMTIGIGTPVDSVFNIHQSYKAAYDAIRCVFYRGFGKAICSSSLDKSQFVFNSELLEQFRTYILEDKIQQATDLLENLTCIINRYEYTDINYIKGIYINFLINIIDVLKLKRLIFNEQEIEKVNLLKTIYEIPTLAQIKNLMMSKMDILKQAVDKYNAKSRIVYQIEKYILDNYNSDLDLQTIADAVYLSTAYLCSVFKKETGKTINQYILEVKIDKAKEFLRDNSLKLYEVAEKVGFSNQNYFSKVFYKMVGMNPSEYRERFL